MKHLCSLFVILLFLGFTLASIGPDKSTNVTVAIKDCMEKPPVSANLKVFVHYRDKAGLPIQGIPGTLFFTEQNVKPDTTCTFTYYQLTEDVFTDSEGNFTSGIYPFTHDNSEDLYRVELVLSKTAIFNECRVVKVAKYSTNSITFNCVGIRLNEL